MQVIKKSAIVPHSAEQMYRLVNDIAAYPQFIEWCSASRVISQNDHEIEASLTLAYKGLEKTFTTRNRLVPHEQITMDLIEGPFKHLEGIWQFNPMEDGACQVDLKLEFEFSNKLIGMVFGPVFNQVAMQLVDAFVARANEVYV